MNQNTRTFKRMLSKAPSGIHGEDPYWLGKRKTNAAILVSLLALSAGVYYYTIAAIGQEEFEDFDEKGNLIRK